MSLEGSTPLSHNSFENNEKAAVAISELNDNLDIPPPSEKSSNRLEDGSMFITQMKTEEIKANIFANIFASSPRDRKRPEILISDC